MPKQQSKYNTCAHKAKNEFPAQSHVTKFDWYLKIILNTNFSQENKPKGKTRFTSEKM